MERHPLLHNTLGLGYIAQTKSLMFGEIVASLRALLEGNATCSPRILLLHSRLICIVPDSLVSPKIHPFTVPEALQRGDRLSLTCSVFKGNKPIEISWSRSPLQTDPGSPTSPSSAPLPPTVKPVQIDAFTSMLAIADLDLAHNGAYTCRAENAAGSVAHTAVVRVNGK